MKAFISLLVILALAIGGIIIAEQKGLVDLPLSKIPGLSSFDRVATDEVDEALDTSDSETSDTSEETVTPSKAAKTPKVAARDTSTTEPMSAEDREIAKLYPLPPFRPIDDLLEDWTKIPPTVFPREVKLTQPVKYEMRSPDGKVIGSSTMQAGRTMFAIGSNGNQIHLANSKSANEGSFAPIESTDLQAQMNMQYDSFKSKLTAGVLAKRNAEKDRRASSGASSGGSGRTTPPAPAFSSSKMPKDDPRFQPMIQSLESGRFTEMSLDKVTSWRWIGPHSVGGRDYEAGLVGFQTQTIFGALDTEAMALIKNGRVEKWVYTGSMEEVQ